MTTSKQGNDAFQDPGDTAFRSDADRSRRPRAAPPERGASVFVGYVRSHIQTRVRTKAEAQKDQEAWQEDIPPSAA